MIENGEDVDGIDIPKELHSPVLFFVIKVFEDRLLQIYVDRSSRAKMQLFSFMLLWLWTPLLWMRIAGTFLLVYLMTWKVISVGIMGFVTHSCLLHTREAPALAEAKIMGFLSGYVCIELGAWLSWYFALKAIALTPLFLVLLESTLGEVSGLSGVRGVALSVAHLLSIYLSCYSLPFFIVASCIFAPFVATKAVLLILIVMGAALYALGVVQSYLNLEIIQPGTRTLLLCCGICGLFYTAYGSSNVSLGINLVAMALLLPQSLLLLTSAGIRFLFELFRHQTPDILMLSHLSDFAFRYAFYRVSGHVPGTPSCVRKIVRRLCRGGVRVGRFERFEDDDSEDESGHYDNDNDDEGRRHSDDDDGRAGNDGKR
eukprot:CAMPEP_0185276906 /NCGR_PEP_ID=MMETSP1359-20130426/57327_1 /TAXON_ID=552665 /ORGANISM="Bigelowiella longifila, Strain CCMP242" /LENGTH=371 /DNA_ID=CAMNT_0027870785 /DNA_START=87 /DNA_END=1202 /DNA_ORIENTATION=-